MNSDPDFLCPACHTSEDRPTVVVNLGDGTRVRVHEDCHAEVVALTRRKGANIQLQKARRQMRKP